MIDLGPATEDDTILAFLRAEIDSARFGSKYAAILSNSRLDRRSLIDKPDLNSAQDNWTRRELLKLVRGYGSNAYLFRGFPTNVQWRRLGLQSNDLSNLKYANCSPWVELSHGTRIVTDGAKNIDLINTPVDIDKNVKAVADDLKLGKRYPDLIGVNGNSDEIILLEGHTRATAYVLAQLSESIQCIIGSSPIMRNWAFY